MAMHLPGGRRKRAMSEINVTPLVDVMLVLLVIFMITAPVLQEGFHVDLPQASETQSIPVADARQVVIAKGGEVLRLAPPTRLTIWPNHVRLLRAISSPSPALHPAAGLSATTQLGSDTRPIAVRLGRDFHPASAVR